MTRLAGLAFLALAGPAPALELALPEGAELAHREVLPPTRISIPTGPAVAGEVPLGWAEGHITHSVWHLSPAVEVAQLLAVMGSELVEEGYDIGLECTARVCGGYDFRFAVEDVGPPSMMVDLGHFGYVHAHNPEMDETVSLLVSTLGQTSYVQVTMVQSAPQPELDTAQVPMAAEVERPEVQSEEGSLAETLLATGGAVLEDLRFESGSATLAGGEFASIAELAEYMTLNPNKSVILVGHSDTRGSTAGNMALSKRRAEAVRRRLIDEYSIPARRVASNGVGYLAPRASNATPEGRRANRRVEVILDEN